MQAKIGVADSVKVQMTNRMVASATRQLFENLELLSIRPPTENRALCRPECFAEFKVAGGKFGVRHVESNPLVRGSYHAWSYSASNRGGA